GEIEHVSKAIAKRLEDDRKRSEARRDREEVGRALSLEPERIPPPWAMARKKEGSGGVLPESRREERGRGEPLGDEILRVAGVDRERAQGWSGPSIRDAEDDAVVRCDRVDREGAFLLEERLDGDRPRSVDRGAEGAQDADSPVARLIGERLDDDRPVRRRRPGDLDLLVDVSREDPRRALVEVVSFAKVTLGRLEVRFGDLARQPSDSFAERARASRAIAAPEGHLPGLAGRGGDEHPVVGDALPAPRRGAEKDDAADARPEDHRLHQHTGPPRRPTADPRHDDAVESAVGNRSGVHDRDALGAFAGSKRVADPIPREARA